MNKVIHRKTIKKQYGDPTKYVMEEQTTMGKKRYWIFKVTTAYGNTNGTWFPTLKKAMVAWDNL
jgi:hypothetical protein